MRYSLQQRESVDTGKVGRTASHGADVFHTYLCLSATAFIHERICESTCLLNGELQVLAAAVAIKVAHKPALPQ